MGPRVFKIFLFVGVVLPYGSWCLPVTTTVNCFSGSNALLGDIDEDYEGVVENLEGIPPGESLELVDHLFPTGVTFLQLEYTPGSPTAVIRTSKPLDADALEGGGLLAYAVTCGTGKENTRELNVRDKNDNPPIFDSPAYTVTISETLGVNSLVLRVKAVDADATPANNRVTYSIQGSAPSVFELRADGQILLKERLNYNTGNHYTFTVEARDPHGLSDNVTVTVDVTDFDNMNPYFDHSLYEATIAENQGGPLPSVQPEAIKAQDADTGINQAVTYSITTVTPTKYQDNFAIDAATGVIHVTTPLDREKVSTINVQIKAAQQDDSTKSGNTMVVVNIEDVNDNAPQFDKADFSVAIPENSPADSFVLQAKVTDEDQGGFVGMIRLIPDSVPFTVSQDGTITVNTSADLDRETSTSIQFQVEAREDAPPNTVVTANVQINLLDVNDNSPQFGDAKYEGKVFANQTTGMLVVKVEASDPDEGVNGLVTYSIAGGNQDGYFAIGEDTGQITLVKVIPLEPNTLVQFSLYVVARDGGDISRASSVIVDIQAQDDRPQFLQKTYHASVEEEINGIVEVVKISFQSDGPVPQVETEGDKFSIDANGVLSTKVKLDYETKVNYTVRLSLSDGADHDEAVVEVEVQDVNDNPPEFSRERYDVAVSENMVGGAVLVSLEVTDKDKGGFSNGYFVMTSDTFSINKMGAISLNSDATLDREKQDSYILQVTAVDQPVDGLNSTTQVNITVTDINDNNPAFLPLPVPISVAEGKYTADAPGDVCQIQAEDKDAGENGRVNISTSSYTDTFTFTEDGTLVARADLDRETKDSYDLVIIATDNGKPQRQTITNIRVSVTDVNDNAPVFSMGTYRESILSRDSKVGELVLTVAATDMDAGNNSVITYSFASGSSEYLSLNSETGDITLTSDLSNVTKDTLLNLTAKAEDRGTTPLSSTAIVLIYIRTVSLEEGLAFASPTYNFSVAENKPKGSEVGLVMASSGSSLFDVSYNMKTHTDLFSVDTSGSVRTLVELDKEEKGFYVISVEATDTRVPPSTALTVVTVQVEDVNEVPVFDRDLYSAEIFSIAPFKDSVVKVKATDPDVGETLSYSLVEPSSMFAVEPSSGQVYVVSVAGESGKVSLQVKVEDQQGLYATTTVEVTVKESKDDNVVVIYLNQPINVVEEKTSELEESLERVLGWTVTVISVTNSNSKATDRRSLSSRTVRTYVSFVAMDASGTIVSAKEVQRKLTDEKEKVQAELEQVFGSGLEHEVEKGPGGAESGSMVAIILGVLLGLTMVALVVVVTVSVIKFKDIKKDMGDSDKESFHIKRMSKSSSSSDEDEPAEKSERTPQSQGKAPNDSKEDEEDFDKENKGMSASQDSNDREEDEEEDEDVSSL